MGRPFRLGSPVGYVVLLILGFFLFRNVFQEAGVKKVSYSDFKESVRQGRFQRVQLSNEWVKGFLPPQEPNPAADKTATRGYTARQLRDAVVWREILGPPVSLRGEEEER